jgi:hypothetical protein
MECSKGDKLIKIMQTTWSLHRISPCHYLNFIYTLLVFILIYVYEQRDHLLSPVYGECGHLSQCHDNSPRHPTMSVCPIRIATKSKHSEY